MAPQCPLPLSDDFDDVDTYIESLLSFSTSSDLFQKLCGGVHILDFFTRQSDLYSSVLPEAWRQWFGEHEIEDILDFLMREDLRQFECHSSVSNGDSKGTYSSQSPSNWRGKRWPPEDLCDYVRSIRKHGLARSFKKPDASNGGRRSHMSRSISMGMKPKKIHEVECFAEYVDSLANDMSGHDQKITHLVDFGSGQNYLGRTLASQPFNRHIIAVESKMTNIKGAQGMDIKSKFAVKEKVIRDKRQYRSQVAREISAQNGNDLDPTYNSATSKGNENLTPDLRPDSELAPVYSSKNGSGSIQYVEHRIASGDLSNVIQQQKTNEAIVDAEHTSQSNDIDQNNAQNSQPIPERDGPISAGSESTKNVQDQSSENPQKLMIMSLHSCGNLLHHGVRSLLLNDSVAAVALVGCCYNLLTERLGPPTYKLPSLRIANERLVREGSACDPHGFPMSDRLATYKHGQEEGIRLNITARMMGVQAPQNWTREQSSSFFTRHFFRALLQRIFLDRGAVSHTETEQDSNHQNGHGPAGGSGTDPIIIGSLRKACYSSFTAYVRGAMTKILKDPKRGPQFEACMGDITDAEIESYEEKYRERKKDLSIIWSLMAFSAGVVEAMIVVDRWLFLREHSDVVRECWVEPVFEYEQSPRNLVVVGIKR
ncbi:MAG: hypothetical protein M4579_006691 [Chaenotheca gracillima]|nr:MAG: hypothetical protein M4579_006691 [Chaenotheca gracillima]